LSQPLGPDQGPSLLLSLHPAYHFQPVHAHLIASARQLARERGYSPPGIVLSRDGPLREYYQQLGALVHKTAHHYEVPIRRVNERLEALLQRRVPRNGVTSQEYTTRPLAASDHAAVVAMALAHGLLPAERAHLALN